MDQEKLRLLEVRNKQIDYLLMFLAAIAPIALGMSVYRATYMGWSTMMTMQIIIALFVMVAYVIRKQIRPDIQAIVSGIIFIMLAGTSIVHHEDVTWGIAHTLVAAFIFSLFFDFKVVTMVVLLTTLANGGLAHIVRPGGLDYEQHFFLAVGIGLTLPVTFIGTQLVEALFKETVKSQELVQVAQAEAERADQAAKGMQQFIANMSHELRTPLHVIIGCNQMIKRLLPRNELSGQEYASRALQAAEHLQSLIKQVLDISASAQGKFNVDSHPFRLSDTMGLIIESAQHMIGDKPLAFKLELAEDIPNRVIGDPTAITEVVLNLIGNASKFTDFGYIRLIVNAQNVTTNDMQLTISVQDTGRGIAEDQLDNIFEAFQQSQTSDARQFGGLGLGLAISRTLVDAMQGSIIVESEIDVGSTFIVTLPLLLQEETDDSIRQTYMKAALYQPSVEENDTGPRVNRLEGLRLLLIDDLEDNRFIAGELLRNEGATIDTAGDGGAAIYLMLRRRQHYDAIIMDVQMPETDGFELTRMLREEHGFADLPIIALSARGGDEDTERSLAAGMNAHVNKPVNIDELVSVIRRELNLPQLVGNADDDTLQLTLEQLYHDDDLDDLIDV